MKNAMKSACALFALLVAAVPAGALPPFPTPVGNSNVTMTMTLKPDFFTSPSSLGNLAHLEDCRIHIQTGATSRFEPSPDLAGLGASTQTFHVPTVDQDVEVIVGYDRKFDVVPCGQWGAVHPGSNPRNCPHYRDDPVKAKFHLKMDVNDLNSTREGVRGTFVGTNLVLEMRFEEDGRELSGVVSKKLANVADVSFPFKGDLGGTKAKLTFALSASNGALAVRSASLDFDASVSLDAYDHQIPQQLMDKVQLRDQFLSQAKPRIQAAIASSSLPAAIQSAFAGMLRTFGMRSVVSVSPGSNGGADVTGLR